MTAQQLDWMGLVSSMILTGSLLFLSLTFVLELVDFLSWRSVDSELALAAFLLAFFFDPDFVVVPTESVTRLSPSSNVEFLDNWLPGLVTNAILFCQLFTIKDQCNKVSFLQSWFVSVIFNGVWGPTGLAQSIRWSTCMSIVSVPMRQGWGPLKGAV